MNLHHEQVISAEIEYRQEQARRSWPKPRGERSVLRRSAQRVLRALHRPRASVIRRTYTPHLVLGHSALAAARP